MISDTGRYRFPENHFTVFSLGNASVHPMPEMIFLSSKVPEQIYQCLKAHIRTKGTGYARRENERQGSHRR
jgi:hypothetical protein